MSYNILKTVRLNISKLKAYRWNNSSVTDSSSLNEVIVAFSPFLNLFQAST